MCHQCPGAKHPQRSCVYALMSQVWSTVELPWSGLVLTHPPGTQPAWDLRNLKTRLIPSALGKVPRAIPEQLLEWCRVHCPSGGHCHKGVPLLEGVYLVLAMEFGWVFFFPSRMLHCSNIINDTHFTVVVLTLWLIGVYHSNNWMLISIFLA